MAGINSDHSTCEMNERMNDSPNWLVLIPTVVFALHFYHRWMQMVMYLVMYSVSVCLSVTCCKNAVDKRVCFLHFWPCNNIIIIIVIHIFIILPLGRNFRDSEMPINNGIITLTPTFPHTYKRVICCRLDSEWSSGWIKPLRSKNC